MILSRIIKRITKITKFEVTNFTTVFKWKMPFFYSQENIHILYIKLKEIKLPIQILLPSEYLFILFQTK